MIPAVERAAHAWWDRHGKRHPDGLRFDDLLPVMQDIIRADMEPLVAAALTTDGPGESVLGELIAELAALQRENADLRRQHDAHIGKKKP